jgi:hypothetical protein
MIDNKARGRVENPPALAAPERDTMRRILIAAVGLLFAFDVQAQNYAEMESVRLYVTGVDNSGAVLTNTSVKVRGKVIAYAISPTTNMACSLYTVSGYGQSVGGSRAIMAANTNVLPITGIQTNMTSTFYVYDDMIRLLAYSSVYTGPLENVTATLLIEHIP